MTTTQTQTETVSAERITGAAVSRYDALIALGWRCDYAYALVVTTAQQLDRLSD